MANSKFLLGLLLGDLAVLTLHYFFSDSLGFLNIEKERSIATVYSGLTFLWIGVAAFIMMWVLRRREARLTLQQLKWLLAGLLFTYLALDDMMEIHERVGFVVNRHTGLTGFWGESFNWIIYFAPLVAAGLILIASIINEIWRTNREAGSICTIGLLFVLFSIILEVVGGSQLGLPVYRQTLLLEETMELFADSFFLAGFFMYVKRHVCVASPPHHISVQPST